MLLREGQLVLVPAEALIALLHTPQAYKPSTPGVESAENQDEIKTTGSRYMDTWCVPLPRLNGAGCFNIG